MSVELKLVETVNLDHAGFLYRLLSERSTTESISHRVMPSFSDHVRFMKSDPYDAWYLIQTNSNEWVGAIYLSKAQEVGLFILQGHRREGFGEAALAQLRELCPGTMLKANVNPLNKASRAFWLKQGFKLLQVTYAK